jgi:hypothetical protein
MMEISWLTIAVLSRFHPILRIPVVRLIISRSSQSLFFECLASLNRRPKLVLLLTWGVYVGKGREKESDMDQTVQG